MPRKSDALDRYEQDILLTAGAAIRQDCPRAISSRGEITQGTLPLSGFGTEQIAEAPDRLPRTPKARGTEPLYAASVHEYVLPTSSISPSSVPWLPLRSRGWLPPWATICEAIRV